MENKARRIKLFLLEKKKIVLFLIMLCTVFITVNFSQKINNDPVAISIDKAHHQIWSKFMDMENGILYDYVDSAGTISIPTPEECEKRMPNALSWWVPNENGAFFNGIYLDALCKKWDLQKDNISDSEARKIAQGLKLLAFVGKEQGFIARGISTDGVSHFPASSPDQLYPWVYGLWHYAQSGIPNDVERKSIITMIEHVVVNLEESNWKIPCERNDLNFFGSFAGSEFSDCSRLLSMLQFTYKLTGIEKWNKLYYSKLNEKPINSNKTRLEILASGMPYKPPNAHNSFWTSSMDQAGLKELFELEKNDEIRKQYKKGLDANAMKAAKHINLYKEFDNDNNLKFNPDWRILNKLWKPQKTMDEALILAEEQLELWDEISPRKSYELMNMMEPLNACWIVVLSGNPDIINPVKEDIHNALTHYDWSKMSYSTFFIAECVYYESLKYGI